MALPKPDAKVLHSRRRLCLSVSDTPVHSKPALGFWSVWALTLGTMIGSGVFLLPAVLAPYGTLSFAGWGLTASGALLLALVLARLAGRTGQSGGVYCYVRDAFGDLAGFAVAWGFWISYTVGMPAMAMGFVGYAAQFVPAIEGGAVPVLTALALIWGLTFINIAGVSAASKAQVLTAILKLVPLVLVVIAALALGDASNVPSPNPQNMPLIDLMSATALLTMWAFAGIEAGTVAAEDVRDAQRTIPRALVAGVVSVVLIYVACVLAAMMLLPVDTLAASTSPFAEAVAGLGGWASALVAIGAMVSVAGALNGTIFVGAQFAAAPARDGLAPQFLTKRNAARAPTASLILGSILATLALLSQLGGDVLDIFTFLVMVSTSTLLVPLLLAALAELKHSWHSAPFWAGLSILAAAYACFTIWGAGWASLAWSLALYAAGLPVLYFSRRNPVKSTTKMR